MWFRIMQQDQIGKHLQSAIRNEAIDEGVFENTVAKLQDKTSIHRVLCGDFTHTGNTVSHGIQYFLIGSRMVLKKIACHLLQIVSTGGQMFIFPNGFLCSPCRADMKIRNMPTFYRLAQGIGSLEFLELPQSLDGENISRSQVLLFAIQFFVSFIEVFLVSNR